MFQKRFLRMLSVIVLLSFISSQVFAMSMTGKPNFDIKPVVLIDIAGIIIGVIAIVIVRRIIGEVGTVIKKPYNYFILGILLQIFALLYTLIFNRFELFAVPGGINIHNLLMVLGLISFVIGAKELSKISKFSGE